jgi:hypothetical protein
VRYQAVAVPTAPAPKTTVLIIKSFFDFRHARAQGSLLSISPPQQR